MLGHKDITITLKVYTKFIKEDEEAIQKHYKVACKKLNQEKFKQELVSYE